jgi:hypothetical protein
MKAFKWIKSACIFGSGTVSTLSGAALAQGRSPIASTPYVTLSTLLKFHI